ncbi:accessory gene regulator ArgB-like protein [Clostridium butyricum]|uniref:Putative accessory gene regulator protein B n=1 Tax=Clostridium butyricum E4 str. BoNT E BL5262 TaxID=632245 RepID=C4II84_CLOBU|nr:accessory gene regulator B family protein [Clostridium butyricum]APF22578.1 accessory regulator [Clostridium butyricum]EDT75812.1 accessory gene regulator B superfamily [Clostridium butyricum 5521]EEP52910.1 putative accessory gene regulator protein B [Clostridium butyricum E4 str. BoNT E BL5262]NFL30153.1 accessory regulator AgrB [Clostridium butyricum]NFS17745.1 accessory regulator AgrB [Clostridium butyricum]
MIKIEQFCENISNYIAKELNLEQDRKSVVNYGIFAFIHMIICIVLIILFGFIFNVMIEALIISFTTSILRKSSGGVHASSPERCVVIGTISTIIMALISTNLNLSCSLNILLGVFVFAFSYYIIYKLAPVDSISKPIKNPNKISKLKKTSINITSIYLLISIINVVVYFFTENYIFLTYSMCIYMGLLWQVFSLTDTGHIILGKLNNL